MWFVVCDVRCVLGALWYVLCGVWCVGEKDPGDPGVYEECVVCMVCVYMLLLKAKKKKPWVALILC